MNFPKFMIRQTGGWAVGAISTRSCPASRALTSASDMATTPSASPSAPIRRTSFHRICSLMRMFFLSIFHLRRQFTAPNGRRLRGGRDERVQGHRAGVSAVAQAHGGRSRRGLLLADDEHAGRLRELGPADTRAELLVAVVTLDAQPRRAQPVRRGVGGVGEAVRDRKHDGLDRSDPEREVAGRVLDQDPDEALERAEDRPVHDDRPVLAPVLADIAQVEALGVLEVALDRAELPRTAERVLDAEVDLRPIERAVAGRHDVRTLRLLERGRQRLFAPIPLLVGPDPLLGTQPERDLHVGEPERSVDGVGEFEESLDLLLDPLERSEDVRVVLAEGPHAREAGRDARELVTVQAAEVREANGKLAVRPQPRLEEQEVARTVHRLDAELP